MKNDNLKAIALLALMLLIFSSCMTNYKGELTSKGKNFIAEYCKGEDSTSHSDRTTILFDTIQIPFPVQGPVQYLENPCKNLCDSLGRLKAFSITKKTNGITGTVKSVGNSIAFDCKTDSLNEVIKTQLRVISDFEKNKTVIEKPCELEHVTGWDWFWIKSSYVLWSIFLLLLVILIAKSYFKFQLPFLK